MTLQQLSQLFYRLGCAAAYNLDGGQSSEMVFLDGFVNQPYKGGRSVSDIVFIADRITSYNVCYTKLLRKSTDELVTLLEVKLAGAVGASVSVTTVPS